MVSRREQEKAANYRKLQLPLISFQRKRPSVIFDEFKYAKQLKENMERVHDDDGDVAQAQNSAAQNPFPVVNVEQKEEKERFLVTVLSEAKCAGLLVFILEALEDVGLDVLHARVSCSENFHLEAAVSGNIVFFHIWGAT
ncbi:uncharacterized protein LOC127795279 isoform X2 [Diospyros lotus]|uniref:uncharacterized protein LOC127795279 isoform X2 n=1 Tax=Diospyros lotus TaxID=55363 RepID=UPI002257D31C|nr:uncharacterized protein LOC127795279 isoform X2 [Diospyros lotus]